MHLLVKLSPECIHSYCAPRKRNQMYPQNSSSDRSTLACIKIFIYRNSTIYVLRIQDYFIRKNGHCKTNPHKKTAYNTTSIVKQRKQKKKTTTVTIPLQFTNYCGRSHKNHRWSLNLLSWHSVVKFWGSNMSFSASNGFLLWQCISSLFVKIAHKEDEWQRIRMIFSIIGYRARELWSRLRKTSPPN